MPEDDQNAVLADYAKSARLLAPLASYSWSTSQPEHPGVAQPPGGGALRPLLSSEGGSRPAVPTDGCPWSSRSRQTSPTRTCCRRRPGRRRSAWTGSSRPTPRLPGGLRSGAAEVEAPAPAVSPAPAGTSALEVLRLLRDVSGTGLTLVGVGGVITRGRPRAPRRRRGPAAGLHRVHLRGAGWPRRTSRSPRDQSMSLRSPVTGRRLEHRAAGLRRDRPARLSASRLGAARRRRPGSSGSRERRRGPRAARVGREPQSAFYERFGSRGSPCSSA